MDEEFKGNLPRVLSSKFVFAYGKGQNPKRLYADYWILTNLNVFYFIRM